MGFYNISMKMHETNDCPYDFFLIAEVGFQNEIPEEVDVQYMQEVFKRAQLCRTYTENGKYVVQVFNPGSKLWVTSIRLNNHPDANSDIMNKAGILVLRPLKLSEVCMTLFED